MVARQSIPVEGGSFSGTIAAARSSVSRASRRAFTGFKIVAAICCIRLEIKQNRQNSLWSEIAIKSITG